MQKYVDLLEYGNRDIGGGIDQFWLTGDLRIDPVQQVDFVDRLRRGVLPVSKRSQDLVRDILPVTKAGDAVIHAKCGLLGAETRQPRWDGWSAGPRRAARIPCLRSTWTAPSRAILPTRMKFTQQCLSRYRRDLNWRRAKVSLSYSLPHSWGRADHIVSGCYTMWRVGAAAALRT